jgi:internalin A
MPDEPQLTEPLELFYSYSHRDVDLRDELETHLSMLKRQKVISGWHDRGILPGEEWGGEIDEHLKTADLILLLVSPNFLASDFITENELQPLLEDAKRDGVTILWVAVSACLYKETEIANYQAANNPDRPLNTLRPAEVNKQLVNICEQIKSALDS